MHHCPSPALRQARTYAGGRSPLRLLEESFLALTSAPEPLTLPAHLAWEEPEQLVMPVDQVRTRLAHPATAPVLRERTWREVVHRAQRLGQPWDTVAVAMTVPVLRRMLARLSRPAHLERAEVEQEALAAVAIAVHTVDVHARDVGRELFSAADRAVHRLVYATRRQAARETAPTAAHLERLSAPEARTEWSTSSSAADDGGEVDEYAVLALAVRARVVDLAEARLIARTRLEGEPMRRLADERRVSARQLYRHRTAAEQHLAEYLRARLRAQ